MMVRPPGTPSFAPGGPMPAGPGVAGGPRMAPETPVSPVRPATMAFAQPFRAPERPVVPGSAGPSIMGPGPAIEPRVAPPGPTTAPPSVNPLSYLSGVDRTHL